MASGDENLVTNLVEPHKKLSIDILKQRLSDKDFLILTDYVTIILINLNYY